MRKRMTMLAALTLCSLFLSLEAMGEASDKSAVAGAADMTDVIDVASRDLNPVTGEMLKEGIYPVQVDVSSAMFKVTGCDIHVSPDGMTATLYMGSEAYSFMYPGEAEDAARAKEEDLIPLTALEDGRFAFTLPLEALDDVYSCAAFSARKEMWYPRSLVFRADSLPPAAFKEDFLVTVKSLALEEGTYTCEVTLSGEGRAQLISPALLHVEGDACLAEIVFATAKIDYVSVAGEKITPDRTENGAAFTVPVPAFDLPVTIIVDSTAIKPATEVTYAMTFHSASITPQ